MNTMNLQKLGLKELNEKEMNKIKGGDIHHITPGRSKNGSNSSGLADMFLELIWLATN